MEERKEERKGGRKEEEGLEDTVHRGRESMVVGECYIDSTVKRLGKMATDATLASSLLC